MDSLNEIDDAVMNSPELLGKECCGCYRVLAFRYYQKDSSIRDGYKDVCNVCLSTPRLSTSEHVHRQREINHRAANSQRWEHQEELYNDDARIGRALYSSDFVTVIKQMIPNLYVTQGRIIGNLAAFKTYGQPQPRLDGRTFEYLFYIPTGLLPEFSLYEFDNRDVPIREKQRGWRTVLLRLIKSEMVTEQYAHQVFGAPSGEAASRYLRTLYDFRNSQPDSNPTP